MHAKILCLAAFLALATTANAKSPSKIVCYYQSWTKYSNTNGKYTVRDIPAKLCTHVIYSFIAMNTDGTVRAPEGESDLNQFVSHVKKSGAKAIIAIGGDGAASKPFSPVASNPSTRKRFVRNIVSFLDKHKLQGLDVDWEFPTKDGPASDKQNHVSLLKELKQAFSGKGYSLSAAVAAERASASKYYNIREISKYLDFINVMTYDFNGHWGTIAGMNAPLYASSKDTDYQKSLNVDASVQHWISQGAPRNKIIVGMPFYGRTYTLKNANNHGLYDPISGPGKANPYSNTKGIIGYNEMCLNLRDKNWHVVHDPKIRVPYAYKGKEWINYDDAQSIRTKAEYVKSTNLGGAMIWSINTDDFRGECGKKNKLLNTIHDVLK